MRRNTGILKSLRSDRTLRNRICAWRRKKSLLAIADEDDIGELGEAGEVEMAGVDGADGADGADISIPF
jgi:hypothetical protein